MGAFRPGPLDGNLATEAHLARPDRLAVDSDDLYLLDTGMARVRRIDGDGVIHHVAGNGDYGFPSTAVPPPTSRSAISSASAPATA